MLASFLFFVVYTLTSLIEQTTPAGHLILDAYASVSNISFVDKDLDKAELGGLVLWAQLYASGADRVVVYKIYLSECSTGKRRLQVVDDVAMDVNELLIPSEIPLLNFTHLVVYTQSSMIEQATPVPCLCSTTSSLR